MFSVTITRPLWFTLNIKSILRQTACHHLNCLSVIHIHGIHPATAIELAPQAIKILQQSSTTVDAVARQTTRKLEQRCAGDLASIPADQVVNWQPSCLLRDKRIVLLAKITRVRHMRS